MTLDCCQFLPPLQQTQNTLGKALIFFAPYLKAMNMYIQKQVCFHIY